VVSTSETVPKAGKIAQDVKSNPEGSNKVNVDDYIKYYCS